MRRADAREGFRHGPRRERLNAAVPEARRTGWRAAGELGKIRYMTRACETCGAPPKPGMVSCEYCHQPISAEAADGAIPCPSCHALNAWGATRCGGCQAWVVVQCVFCGGITPHNQAACMHCGEAFAGAPERKAERERAHMMQTAASVAAPVLGAVAVAVLEDLFD